MTKPARVTESDGVVLFDQGNPDAWIKGLADNLSAWR